MHQGKAKTIEFTTDNPLVTPVWTDIGDLAEEGNEYPTIEESAVALLDGAETGGGVILRGSIRSLDVGGAFVALMIAARLAGTRVYFKYTSFDGLMVTVLGIDPMGGLLKTAHVQGFTGAKSVFIAEYSFGGSDEADVQTNTIT